LADLIPKEFEIDAEFKKEEHEAVPLVPFIDSDRIRREVSKIKLSKESLEINRVGENLVQKDYFEVLM
jgi:5'-3' exonuclease